MTDALDPAARQSFLDLLHAQRVWDSPLPAFDPDTAPATPHALFLDWFAEAVAAGQPEPHTMSLATADADGLPDVRTLMLHDVDERGWHFATHSTSAKGGQLAARPYAALGFYWPVQGRQIRVRGPVTACPTAESAADLHARSTGALAAALVGRQSEILDSADDLGRAFDAAWRRAGEEPGAEVASWTRYVVEPREAEFFQGDAGRRHVRLRYRRTADVRTGAGTWERERLWP
ncbi:pyridoxal 5'-phosphate synthase [Streptomyces sp. NPDC013181]|uniref:pyridoxine/pyridoxamine 5'-phosphate oxidase n=1 Tax=unclassified Streptomyces TaxID=2593676 RepID=UPI00368E6693